MNELNVVGIERIDYQNKNGYRVVGNRYHCLFEAKAVTGMATDFLYLSDTFIEQNKIHIEVGDNLAVYYNKYGKVAKVDVI